MKVRIVSVTKKGQATIPKDMREKHGIKDKALAVDTSEGVLIKGLPSPEEDFGSLKELLEGKTVEEILAEARSEDERREKKLLGYTER